ncbi:hypothetical protein KXX46_002306, partial [Aspergillus fumigatus]
PNSKRYFTQWMFDVWRNKFLFSGIMIGFVTTFPILYIPVINDVVFKHVGISWDGASAFISGTPAKRKLAEKGYFGTLAVIPP